MCSIPCAGWVGIIYHSDLKNNEKYTPVIVEGIYHDWEKCCEVDKRLTALVDEIGYFRMAGEESVTSAIAQLHKWKAHAQSLEQCDQLLEEPGDDVIENFFDVNNIKQVGATVHQLKEAYFANLFAQVCTSDE